jgi:hypothetical protein
LRYGSSHDERLLSLRAVRGGRQASSRLCQGAPPGTMHGVLRGASFSHACRCGMGRIGPFPGQIADHQAVRGCLQPRADGEERQQGRPAALTGDTGRYGPEWPSGNPGRTGRIAPPRGQPACSSARPRSASPLLSPARSRPGSPRSAMAPTRRRYRPPGSRARGWRPFGNRVPASTLAGRD